MATVKDITPDLRKIVDQQLISKEKIIWMDQPISTVSKSDFKFMYFLEIGWTIIFFWVFGLKSIIGAVMYIGILLLILIPLFIHFKFLKTVYIITNKRAIIIEPAGKYIRFKNLFSKDILKTIVQVINPFHFNFCDFDYLILKIPVHSSVIRAYTPRTINNFAIFKGQEQIGNVKLSSKIILSIFGFNKIIYFGFFNIKNPQQVGQIISNQIEEYRINNPPE